MLGSQLRTTARCRHNNLMKNELKHTDTPRQLMSDTQLLMHNCVDGRMKSFLVGISFTVVSGMG